MIDKKTQALSVALLLFILALSSCRGFSGEPEKLVVWSSSMDLAEMIDYYKEMRHIDPAKLQIEFVYKNGEDYTRELEEAVSNGQSSPDIFAIDSAYVKKFVESGRCLDLGGLKKAASGNFPYTLDIGKDSQGRLMALSWEIAPGAYFYRRSIAKKYLGTDDPAKIQSMISSTERFMETAEALKQKSAGQAAMIASLGDLYQVFKAGRKDGWVRADKLIIDPIMIMLLEQSKTMRTAGYDAGQTQMDKAWFDSLRDELRAKDGSSRQVLGYFLPAWGLDLILKPNALSRDGKRSSAGDWAMVQGPIPYYWGGSWIMANASTPSKGQARALIRFLCTDPIFQERWAREKNKPVSSVKVMEKLKKNYVEPFLNGQNSFAIFSQVASGLTGKNATESGPFIDGYWQKQLGSFVRGDKDIQTVITDFKTEVKANIPELQVE